MPTQTIRHWNAPACGTAPAEHFAVVCRDPAGQA